MKLIFDHIDTIAALAQYARCTKESITLADDVPEVVAQCDSAPAIPTTGRPRGSKRKPVEKTYPTTPE